MKQLSSRALKFCFVVITVLSVYSSKAQYVTIPDATFVSWLQSHGYAACMSGNQLDTTCGAVLNAKSMYCYAVPIRDLTGIQYFKHLDSLDCSNDSLYIIPAFPATLRYVNCEKNNLTALPSLPDTLNSLICNSNQLTVLPTLNTNLIWLQCHSNAITSLPSMPPFLGYLDFSSNFVSSLPAITSNLTHLICYSNHLSTLNTLPATLFRLQCENNLLTAMPALPPYLNTLNCDNNRIISLPVLPVGLNYLSCSHNPLSSLPALPGPLVQLICKNDNLNSLPALPYGLNTLVCDSNNLVSIGPVSNTMNWFTCSFNNLTSLPDLSDSLTLLACNNNPGLSCLPELKKILILSFQGTGITCLPNFGSVTSSSPPLSILPLCGIFNLNGCQPFWNISGQSYYDQNNDCVFDSIDVGTNYVKTQLFDNTGALVQQTFTGGEGFYSFDAVAYGSYMVQIDTSNLPFAISCPGSGYYSDTLSAIDSLSYSNNFALKCRTQGFDIGVQSVLNDYQTPRPNATFVLNTVAGDMSQLYGAHCAAGISGQVQIVYSGQLSYVGASYSALTPTSVSGDTVTWAIADFGAVNDFTAFNLLFKIDSLATPGTQLCFTTTVTPATGDYNPSNNTLSYCFPIVNALDPNEKEVYPAGKIDTGSQWLTYTIRFQNTGTAPALNVLVTDTLDANLDPSTFQLLTYSAKNLTQIFGNIVKFNFPNINLPDSATSDSASRGYVQFKIKTNGNITPGAKISNTAYIYFDLNTAVVTNTVTDTFGQGPNGIRTIETDDFGLRIYPNPANNQLHIEVARAGTYNSMLFDIEGQLIYTTTTTANIMDVSKLATGVYIAEINSNEVTQRLRFVKM